MLSKVFVKADVVAGWPSSDRRAEVGSGPIGDLLIGIGTKFVGWRSGRVTSGSKDVVHSGGIIQCGWRCKSSVLMESSRYSTDSA
jgi:hypothetical protein